MLPVALIKYNPFPFPVFEQLEAWCWQITLIFLLFLFLVFPLCFYLGRQARKDKRLEKITVFTIGILLITTEIYKQLLFAYHYNFDSYHWDLFPFQLCSIPMYTAVIVAFLKDGKFKTGLYSFMALFGMLGGLAVTFYQNSVLTWEDYSLDYQSIIWHFALVGLGIYSATYLNIGSKTFKEDLKTYEYGALVFLACLIMAEIINLLIVLNHGYNEYTQGGNMFYISMFMFNLDIPILSTVTSTCGWYIGFIGYTFVLLLGGFVILNAYRLINFLNKKHFYKEKIWLALDKAAHITEKDEDNKTKDNLDN